MRRTTYVYVFIIILLLAGGIYSYWQRLAPTPSAQTAAVDNAVTEDPEAAQAANAAGLSPEAAQAAQTAAKAPLGQTYKNSNVGFSFQYPQDLKVGSSVDPTTGATTVLVQNAVQHIGFQIYITPYNGPDTQITADDVNAQLPQMHLSSPQEVQISGIPALAFLAQDPNFGNSRQVWFVHAGHLYQVSAYSSQDSLLSKVLTTWLFTK